MLRNICWCLSKTSFYQVHMLLGAMDTNAWKVRPLHLSSSPGKTHWREGNALFPEGPHHVITSYQGVRAQDNSHTHTHSHIHAAPHRCISLHLSLHSPLYVSGLYEWCRTITYSWGGKEVGVHQHGLAFWRLWGPEGLGPMGTTASPTFSGFLLGQQCVPWYLIKCQQINRHSLQAWHIY